VSSVGPTFWFGGTVKDSNPHKIGQEGFLELQFYPDSFTKNCTGNGGFSLIHEPNVYTACSPVWTIRKKGRDVSEPTAFNGMLRDASGKNPFVMHALDFVDVHIWAPTPNSAYREQVTDETSGQTSSALVLISPSDGPLTPEFSTNEIGNALDWGGVWDTPMAFVWEIGHSYLYGDHPGQFCVPGQTFCGSFNSDNWAGFTPIPDLRRHLRRRLAPAALGGGLGHRREGGGARQLVRRPDRLHGVRRSYCIYPWFSWDGGAINYGVHYANTVDDLGGADQFAQVPTCPEDGVFAGPTYCDTIIR